ncbi:MAG: hypothetical protein P857_1111 [Candidatus Xenolissoclinum pacificiensis L6]|uniref:Uncharacterized protein n=1 Tax=Candidatus Xenolissoclinum pacificiensis L6 TaxID=1401685 RepID=W2V0I3_9RICK|nr:MAG: hypothetical protein P857_1111 [Candidatus Xenolissoclinum pacificiensis L6]
MLQEVLVLLKTQKKRSDIGYILFGIIGSVYVNVNILALM